MDLEKLRESHTEKIEELKENLRSIDEKDVRHFRQEGDGPLADITEKIKAEYYSHIDTYSALIAQIDAMLGV